MFGVLLESRARRQRRSGGIALSVVTHLAIISATVAGTTVARTPPKPEKPVIIPVAMDPKPAEPKPVPRKVRTSTSASPNAPTVTIKHIDVPITIPRGIPAIDMTAAIAADSIVIGGGKGTSTGPIGGGLIDGGTATSSEWRGNDAYMNLIKSATPRYPEVLRQSCVDGHVLIRFTVDTLGRIDAKSVEVLSSTHELFSRAVRDALSGFRFRPAESNGKRVPALAEMPFEFSITRK